MRSLIAEQWWAHVKLHLQLQVTYVCRYKYVLSVDCMFQLLCHDTSYIIAHVYTYKLGAQRSEIRWRLAYRSLANGSFS